VLTDEMLQELGLSKKLHRLVLIKKIAKEKSRSQQHENLHMALASLIKHHLSRGTGGREVKGGGEEGAEGEGEGEDEFRSRAGEMEKHCRDIIACMSPPQLQSELLAKLKAGGWMCETMLYNFGKSYRPVADKEVMRLMPGMISGAGGGSRGGGGRGSGGRGEESREGKGGDLGGSSMQMASQAMRVTLLMLNSEENRGSLKECAGIMEAVVCRMEACEGDQEIQVLGLAIMLTLCYSAENIDELVRQVDFSRLSPWIFFSRPAPGLSGWMVSSLVGRLSVWLLSVRPSSRAVLGSLKATKFRVEANALQNHKIKREKQNLKP